MSLTIKNNTTNESYEKEGGFDFNMPDFSIPSVFKKDKTITILEYAENCMKTFEELPFGVVDSLMLSQLCYLHMEKLIPGVEYNDREPIRVADLYKAEYFDEIMENVRDPKSNRRLLNALCASPRYRDIKVNYYINIVDDKLEKQFAAMTFILPDGTVYVAFRGTDATVVGWKEDFNMFFDPVVPSHISSVHYLEVVAQRTKGKMYIGGHSKGGNLALYGATFAGKEIQDRIITVFNHDGPALSPEIKKDINYIDLGEKIQTTVPEASIFGLMFSSGDYKVVQSNRLGIMQHDPFSWEIADNDFVYAEEVKHASSYLVDMAQEMMNTLNDDDKEAVVDTLFDIIKSSGTTTFVNGPTQMIKEFDQVIHAMKNIDEKSEESIKVMVTEFFKLIAKQVLKGSSDEKDKWERVNQILEEEGHNHKMGI